MNNYTPLNHNAKDYPSSLLNLDALIKDDPELAFYQLQNTMHQIFEWIALEEKMRGFPIPIMKQVSWRNDGLDLSRASANLVIQLVEIFNSETEVAKRLCAESMRWPFVHHRFAENIKSIDNIKQSLEFTTSATNKPSMGVSIEQLYPYTKLEGEWPKIELINHHPTRESIKGNSLSAGTSTKCLSLANTVLFHHLREIEEYRAAPPYLRVRYIPPHAHYVDSHNLSLSKGVLYTKNYNKPLPRFWEAWQSKSLDLPPLSKETSKEWFNFIWDCKICPEYLGKPAKKPHNPSINNQADLTALVTAQALNRYKKETKNKAVIDRHLARINAGNEDEGSMEGDIKHVLRTALDRHAKFRDMRMPKAVLFSW
jgi:hypothetical protein